MLSFFKTEHSDAVLVISHEEKEFNKKVIYANKIIREHINDELLIGCFATKMICEIYNTTLTVIEDDVALERAKKIIKGKKLDVKTVNTDFYLKNARFELLPADGGNRRCIFAAGSAGSGKTYLTNKFMQKYHDAWKHEKEYGKIQYISIHDPSNDPSLSLKLFEPLMFGKEEVIKNGFVNAAELQETAEISEFENTLTVLDDVDTSIKPKADEGVEEKLTIKERSKKMKDLLQASKLIQQVVIDTARNISENMRKYDASMVFIAHTLRNANTKPISSNCNVLVVFPSSDSAAIPAFLSTRTNLVDKDIKKILNDSNKFAYEPMIYIRDYSRLIYEDKIHLK